MDDGKVPTEANGGRVGAEGGRARSEAESALRELQAGSRIWGGAVLGERGELLAATGANEVWAEGAQSLMAVADAVGQVAVAHVHVATDEGEVYAVRGSTRTIVVVAPRFQLASLMLADMRASLRQLEKESE
jgi:hypothetical protein